MRMTMGLVMDFLEKEGYALSGEMPPSKQQLDHVRLYYPGIRLTPGSLYVAAAEDWNREDRDLSGVFCVVTDRADTAGRLAAEGECVAICTPSPAAEVFGLLQEQFEAFARWDETLSELLLRDASMQELLECSAPFLGAPCFLQDANFNLLAAWGQVDREENAFFYETLRTGRAPSGLFTRLLAQTQPRPPYNSPRVRTGVVKDLPEERVLIADCCVNGVTALHFCLYYGSACGRGLPAVIAHLMRRLEDGPSIRRLAGKSTDLHDELFSKLLEDPDTPDFDEICTTLGLFRFQYFTVICMDFKNRGSSPDPGLGRLRALYPCFWFFRHEHHVYALLGSNPQTDAADAGARASFLNRLLSFGASWGSSLEGVEVRALPGACSQARMALALAVGDGEPGAAYRDVMVRHMIRDFYERYPFQYYCPENFLRLLKEDVPGGTDNLTLLGTYLANNCNATQVGRVLHMHRNNVLYRIGRLKTRYRLDLDSGRSRLLLWILTEKAAMDRRQGDKTDCKILTDMYNESMEGAEHHGR